MFFTFHIKDIVDILGRKIMSGDVVELPHLKDEYSLNTEEINDTKKYLSELLEKKMINKNNDVVYDKDKEKLSKINHLNFNNKTRKFFIKKNKSSSISQTLRKKTKKIIFADFIATNLVDSEAK